MLKDHSQLQLSLSPYQGLYDAIIPADHLLRRIKENIDFSFVNPMLRKQYCENSGRPAKEPEMMFKLLFLKKLYDLSDEALISSAQTDMAYKFFLDLEPEAKMIENAKENGIKVTEVIGDMAYVSDDNLEVCGKEITLIARTNTAVAAAANGNLEEGFCFNKDAGMLQCPAGELSTRVEKRTAKNGNTYLRYIFSKVTCRKCPQREKYRVGRSNAKTRSYSITQASEKKLERLKFEESEYFQERMKIRHRIEEKNGELKEAHGLRKADSKGLFAMHLQMYFTAFTANVKRIVRLDELAME